MCPVRACVRAHGMPGARSLTDALHLYGFRGTYHDINRRRSFDFLSSAGFVLAFAALRRVLQRAFSRAVCVSVLLGAPSEIQVHLLLRLRVRVARSCHCVPVESYRYAQEDYS